MGIMFYIGLFLSLIAFIKNRIGPNKKKIDDLESRIAQLEYENKEIKNKL